MLKIFFFSHIFLSFPYINYFLLHSYLSFLYNFFPASNMLYIYHIYDIYSIKHSALAHNNTEDNQWISFPSSFMQQVIDNHCPNTHTKVNRASKPDLWQLYRPSRTFLSWTIEIVSYDLLLLSHL